VALRPCLLAAAALASTGEFSLVLLERISDFPGILSAEAAQILLASTAISMGLVPTMMRLAEQVAPALQKKGWLRRKETCLAELTPEGNLEGLHDHVIICGFGPVGRNLYLALRKCGIPALVLELNADTVKELMREGVRVLFADARHPEALEMAGITRARSIAFTFPDAEAAVGGMRLARERNPEILVYARAKFSAEAMRLREQGVNQVFHDERESGQALIKSVVSCYDPEHVFDELAW
jgi:CPA2 family monovalent cation:H+ antiporter-2